MPFSIKRFTIHRSSSLPTHSGGSKKEDKTKKGADAPASKKGGAPSSRPRGLPTSQSVDTADLRRVHHEEVPALPPHDRTGTGPRWRGKERGGGVVVPPRPPPDDPRRVAVVRRNGVRFQDSDWGTEESQSTSSSSGGGTARDYWDDPKPPPRDGRWSNGRRGGRSASGSSRGPSEWSEDGSSRHSGKRSQGRRHHQEPQPPPLIEPRPVPMPEMEPGMGRHPLYTPPLYDEDPGIMSEVETSATGFRTIRAPKPARIASFPPPPLRSVKPPPHLDRSNMGPVSPQLRHENLTLGLVFLQYRSETKRALLPNEVTTLDTVKALFVRSFPKQLSMEYLDSPHIRIYIHDPAKDMFYELEDLRDIRDRSVLRIYEQEPNGEGGVYSTWEQELSYFSEPEFDSEYQNQHIHRAKNAPPGYYGVNPYSPIGQTQSLPPGASLRAYSPLPLPDRPKPPIGMPPVAYAQTLPWGAHLTYAPSGPPSPERRPKEILLPPGVMQPPPKPQRSFQQTKGMRCTPPTGPPPSIPSPRSSMPRPIVDGRAPPYPRFPPEPPPRRHEPQGAYRPTYAAQPLYGASPPERHHYDPPGRRSFEGGYLSSPERQRTFPAPVSPYEEPYYGGAERIYGTRSGSVTPVVDEEARLRVEYMERQLASLTGLVQKALSAPPPPVRQSSAPQQQIPTRDVSLSKERGQGEGYSEARSSKSSSCASLTEDIQETHPTKYSFKEEKSVSFSDETTTGSSPVQKQHSPQHAAERPAKPAIKSSLSLRSQHSSDIDSVPTQLHPPTVKVTSADEGVFLLLSDRDTRSKPAPPPKPSSLSERQHSSSPPTREFRVSAEMYSQLRQLRKQTKDLRLEVRNLRRIAQSQAITAKETVRETCLKIKTMLAAAQMGEEHVCAERLKVSQEEELYRQDVNHLEKDLLELERQVEELRGDVINRKCRVNLGDVEGMAVVLSRASKAVAELKARFPMLQESLKTIMAVEMEVVVREEKFLKDEPERLESALRRCKKLTGTLVTLKRLASVQEQRHTVGHHLPVKSHSADGPHSDGEMHSTKPSDRVSRVTSLNPLQSWSLDSPHTIIHVPPDAHQKKTETALDALLNELQTFNVATEHHQRSRDNIPGLLGPQRRLPSYPSADSPVRSPIHGGSRSPVEGPPKLLVNTSGKSLSPTPIIVTSVTGTEKRLSPIIVTTAPPATEKRLSPIIVTTTTERRLSPDPAPPKKVPPPPPPRTTSRSPVTSPTEIVKTSKETTIRNVTNRATAQRSNSVPTPARGSTHPTLRQTASSRPSSREKPDSTPVTIIRTSAINDEQAPQLSSNSSSSESVNSQEGLQMALQAARAEQRKVSQQLRDELSLTDELFKKQPKNRQELLEQRHQELLKKQKQLQEQYQRLQQIQRGQVFARFGAKAELKKTGSESNILSKAGLLSLAAAASSGSMQHLPVSGSISNPVSSSANTNASLSPNSVAKAAANKIFETDIL